MSWSLSIKTTPIDLNHVEGTTQPTTLNDLKSGTDLAYTTAMKNLTATLNSRNKQGFLRNIISYFIGGPSTTWKVVFEAKHSTEPNRATLVNFSVKNGGDPALKQQVSNLTNLLNSKNRSSFFPEFPTFPGKVFGTLTAAATIVPGGAYAIARYAATNSELLPEGSNQGMELAKSLAQALEPQSALGTAVTTVSSVGEAIAVAGDVGSEIFTQAKTAVVESAKALPAQIMSTSKETANQAVAAIASSSKAAAYSFGNCLKDTAIVTGMVVADGVNRALNRGFGPVVRGCQLKVKHVGMAALGAAVFALGYKYVGPVVVSAVNTSRAVYNRVSPWIGYIQRGCERIISYLPPAPAAPEPGMNLDQLLAYERSQGVYW